MTPQEMATKWLADYEAHYDRHEEVPDWESAIHDAAEIIRKLAKPTIEIIHGRDPDSSCEHTLFLNGERFNDYTMESLDPGRGWERADWEDFKQTALSSGSPAYLAALSAEFEAFDDSKYIEDEW